MSPPQLRRTIVVTEKATDAQTAANRAVQRLRFSSVDEFIAEPLMRAFAMVVDHELRERATDVPLTKRDDAV
jgi:ABC-type transporter lipoprotein component MlaA